MNLIAQVAKRFGLLVVAVALFAGIVLNSVFAPAWAKSLTPEADSYQTPSIESSREAKQAVKNAGNKLRKKLDPDNPKLENTQRFIRSTEANHDDSVELQSGQESSSLKVVNPDRK